MIQTLAAVVLVTVISTGMAAGSEARLKHSEFRESVQAEVAVSGSVLVGAHSTDIASGRDVGRIKIPSFAGNSSEVCLSVVTRDGVYMARNTYVLPNDESQAPVALPYKHSKSLQLLSNYSQDQVAISVLEGDCDAPERRIILPAQSPGATDSILLMVNGLGATDVFVRFGSSIDESTCKPLIDDKSVVFDFLCEIALPDAKASGHHELLIGRERFGRELPEAKMLLYVGLN